MQRNALASSIARGIMEMDAEDTLEVKRGRDAWAMLRDAVLERRARGLRDPERIVVAPWAAGCLHAFIRFWAKGYDGVLPPICGVMVVEGMTGGQDAELVVVDDAGHMAREH